MKKRCKLKRNWRKIAKKRTKKFKDVKEMESSKKNDQKRKRYTQDF